MASEIELHRYIAIDLKSFYASVECIARGLDPMTTNLVVADKSRTEKTICLAVSPSLKAYGIPGRPRLFEVMQTIQQVNWSRRRTCNSFLMGESYNVNELQADKTLAVSYLIAPPQMAHYMSVSAQIYNIYLRYVAPEDIHIYSIDEVFIDATNYLKTYHMTAYQFTRMLIRDVLKETGIIATAGIGTNLYLCKIAMDIVAKHIPADENGSRIAMLDEASYRKQLWEHRPLTDFWRIGTGYAQKLESQYLFTMGDIAKCSIYHEDLLYKMFGVNAELLIDHAWGWEPCTIADIKAYVPENNSISSGQVLQCPYNFEKGNLIVREMTDLLALDLVDKGLVTDQMVLTVGYDTEGIPEDYMGKMTIDRYGRRIPKSAHGSINLGKFTSSTKTIVKKISELYHNIVNRDLLVRRIYVVANHVTHEHSVVTHPHFTQLDLFTDYEMQRKKQVEEKNQLTRERNMQIAILEIKKKYGKNAILKGMDLEEGATTILRNGQVGGHRA